VAVELLGEPGGSAGKVGQLQQLLAGRPLVGIHLQARLQDACLSLEPCSIFLLPVACVSGWTLACCRGAVVSGLCVSDACACQALQQANVAICMQGAVARRTVSSCRVGASKSGKRRARVRRRRGAAIPAISGFAASRAWCAAHSGPMHCSAFIPGGKLTCITHLALCCSTLNGEDGYNCSCCNLRHVVSQTEHEHVSDSPSLSATMWRCTAMMHMSWRGAASSEMQQASTSAHLQDEPQLLGVAVAGEQGLPRRHLHKHAACVTQPS
jgi:hypothetical protein